MRRHWGWARKGPPFLSRAKSGARLIPVTLASVKYGRKTRLLEGRQRAASRPCDAARCRVLAIGNRRYAGDRMESRRRVRKFDLQQHVPSRRGIRREAPRDGAISRGDAKTPAAVDQKCCRDGDETEPSDRRGRGRRGRRRSRPRCRRRASAMEIVVSLTACGEAARPHGMRARAGCLWQQRMGD